MAEYPGGSDLGLDGLAGERFSLVWGRGRDGELNAELGINDGYEGIWSSITLDRAQILKLAAVLIVGLSPTGETVDVITRALEAANIGDTTKDLEHARRGPDREYP